MVHQEDPLELLLAQFSGQIHVDGAQRPGPDGERSREEVLAADFVRSAGAQRNDRKEHDCPAGSSHDSPCQLCHQMLAEKSVGIHRQVGPVLLEDPALQKHDRLLAVERPDLIDVQVSDVENLASDR
jgi:hypothetical protein